jgi:hypothetical protein
MEYSQVVDGVGDLQIWNAVNNMMSHVYVTIDGVGIGDSIY